MTTPITHNLFPTAAWPTLALRAELKERVRTFFRQRGFLEVDTPILSADTVVDRHLDPLETELRPANAPAGTGRRLFLQTSPEFCLKRLMAAGGEAIYQVTHAFRQGETGPIHNPEFTIVEWYRRGDGLHAGMQLLSDLAHSLLGRGEAEPITYRSALLQHAGVDPFAASPDELMAAARRHGIETPAAWQTDPTIDRDTWLDLLLVECVEPQLGRDRPAILHDYPPSQAALALVRDEQPPVAERFELYIDGIELANGYHELLDAEVLLKRNRANNQLRRLDGKPALPEHSRLIDAMRAGLPACSGCALGFDRVVMLAAGAKTIDQVLTFPIDRA